MPLSAAADATVAHLAVYFRVIRRRTPQLCVLGRRRDSWVMSDGIPEGSRDHPVRAERFWDLVGPQDRLTIERAGTRASHPRGTMLLREGEPAGSVLILLSGHVAVVATGIGGRQSLLAFRGPGDVLGELAAVDHGVRSASVSTLEPVDVLRVPVADFVALLTSRVSVTYALLRVVGSRLRVTNVRRVEHRDRTTTQRVSALLAELAVDHGRPRPGSMVIDLPFSQQELAVMAGASREQVVRALRLLRDEGAIGTGRRKISILRPELLGPHAGLR